MRKVLWKLILAALISLTAAIPAYCQPEEVYSEDLIAGTGDTTHANEGSCVGTQMAQSTEWLIQFNEGKYEGSITDLTTADTKSGEIKQQGVNASLVRLRSVIEKNEVNGAYETIRKYTQTKEGTETGNDGKTSGGGKESGVTPGGVIQWVTDDAMGTGQGVYIDNKNGKDVGGDDGTPENPCVTGYMNDGTVIRSDGIRTVIAPNSSEECAKDFNACNDGERGALTDQLLNEVDNMIDADDPISVENPGGDLVPDRKWERDGDDGWIPPSREYVPAQKSTRWGIEYAGISVSVDLDLTEDGNASNTVRVGTEEDYIEATLTASVRYEIVHDKTDYMWNIEQPDGTWFFEDHHEREAGETVRVMLKDAGTYRCQTIPRHYYHVNRYINYTAEGVHHKVEPGDCEDKEIPDPNDPSKKIIVCEETEPLVLDMPLGTVSDVKADMNIHSGIVVDYDNQRWHSQDNPAICVGCPGVYWCVGCDPEVCDGNNRYVCDDNVNELEIAPYSFLTE